MLSFPILTFQHSVVIQESAKEKPLNRYIKKSVPKWHEMAGFVSWCESLEKDLLTRDCF